MKQETLRERSHERLKRWRRLVQRAQQMLAKIVHMWFRLDALIGKPRMNVALRAMPPGVETALSSTFKKAAEGHPASRLPTKAQQKATKKDPTECEHEWTERHGNGAGSFLHCQHCPAKWKLNVDGAGKERWVPYESKQDIKKRERAQKLKSAAASTGEPSGRSACSQGSSGSASAAAAVPAENKCPKCCGPMILRQNKDDHRFFKGCANYPKCKGTRRMGKEESAKKLIEVEPGLSIPVDLLTEYKGDGKDEVSEPRRKQAVSRTAEEADEDAEMEVHDMAEDDSDAELVSMNTVSSPQLSETESP